MSYPVVMQCLKYRWPVAALSAFCMGCADCVVLADEAVPCWRGLSGTTYQEWRFTTDANPASPEIVTNAADGVMASINLGPFASGWQEQVPGFGTRTGYWELGRNGTITLSIPNGAGAPTTGYKDIWVDVIQWHDSGIFSQYAAVSVPGATLLGTERRVVEDAGLGGWMADHTRWRVSLPSASASVLITSGLNGAIVDQVTVDKGSFESICPSNLVLMADGGQCSKSNVTWSVPPLDNCVVSNVTCTPAPGSTFPVGTTAVTCVTTDASAAVAACTFAVMVNDPLVATLQLTVRRLNLETNLVRVCWPIICTQPTLEWTTNVANPSSWTPVNESVEMIDQQNCVTLPAVELVRWFRLRFS